MGWERPTRGSSIRLLRRCSMERDPTAGTATGPAASDSIFDRVLVGVDDTPESVVAAAQARALMPPAAHLAVVAVAETHFAAHAGAAASFAEGGLETETADVLEQAVELADRPSTASRTAGSSRCCRTSAGARDATLIAVGARPHRRLSAAVFGGHESELLHGASRRARRPSRLGAGAADPGRRRYRRLGGVTGRRGDGAVAGEPARLTIVPVVPLGPTRGRGVAGRARGRGDRARRARRRGRPRRRRGHAGGRRT